MYAYSYLRIRLNMHMYVDCVFIQKYRDLPTPLQGKRGKTKVPHGAILLGIQMFAIQILTEWG